MNVIKMGKTVKASLVCITELTDARTAIEYNE
jgi:hypothetical protein